MIRLLLLFSLTGLMTGCSPRLQPFTGSLISEYQFDDPALQRIQFYLSDDIVLRRQLSQGESTIHGGQISIRNGKRIEEIRFPAGTPGVYAFSPGADKLAISFEQGADKYLIFGPERDGRGSYRLLAKEWKRDYGIVTYAGEEYSTSAASAYTTLLVDIDEKSQVQRRVKEVKGRQVRR